MKRLLLWVLLSPSLVLGLALATPSSQPARSPKKSYGKVELLRDPWGVPHVFSETDAGAMYGLGHAVAEDRGFQMYYSLRIIQGRLAELIGDRPSQRQGETALVHDRKMRTFGYYRAARAVAARLDADTRAMLQAYCDGVNDYCAGHRDQLHPLFAKLDLQPEPWTPADCIASWWYLGQFFATDATRELVNYRDRVKGPGVPPPAALPFDDAAAVVGPEDVSRDWLDRVQRFHRKHKLAPSPPPGQGPEGPRFSHAWVVGGKKTTTGAAVLVSDPQTPVRNPSLWYEFHVCGKSFNARGLGVPGSPGLVIGWNEHLAWGATALGADQADLFRLKTDADHPNQYFLDGKRRGMEVVRETIRVKDGKPVELVVRQTHFGPVITPFAHAQAGDPEVALKRVPLCCTDRETIQALLGMMRATDLAQFTRALALWQFPSVNLVFGDRQGNIGYWLQAAIPVRSRLDAHHGALAVDGSDSRYDWQGFVPHELLPHTINPPRGWIASGNHRPVGSFYPISLGPGKGNQGHTIRSWRLYERLTARDRFAPAEVLDIHYDTVNPARRDIVRIGLHLRDRLKRELSSEAGEALKQLEGWYQRGARSNLTEPGSALAGEIHMDNFRIKQTPLAAKYGGGASGLVRFLSDVQTRLSKDAKAKLSREEQGYLDQALAGAWRTARQRYGADPARWQERARAKVEQQRLGYFDSLAGFGSLDPAGDLTTPALSCVDGNTILSQAGQSYTQYIPLHDVDAARSLLPPGHSEKVDSPWRTTTRELWAKGDLHPAPLSRKAVEKIARSTTVLAK
ncbi:MAG: penicillin acylase family protein [Gemmataceae bacterium]|nr:penicillin acylase family protein [Gemmataceae bacterium]